MRVLGVDPGLTRLGIGIVSFGKHRDLQFEHVEVLRTTPEQELPDRITTLGDSIVKILDSQTIDAVAIERVFAGQNLPSVMGVAQITGVVIYIANTRGIPVTMYTPKEVKSRVTGYGAADKQQVTNMVTKILKLGQAPKPADAADALALAITHAWSLSKNQLALTSNRAGIRSGTPAQAAWKAAERASKNTSFNKKP